MQGETLLRLLPPPALEVPADLVYLSPGESPPPPPDHELPHVRLNMVASLDGRAAMGGKASGIGSAADRLLMDALRSRADAVMVGAGTLRAERMTLGVSEARSRRRLAEGRPPQPLAVVLAGDTGIRSTLRRNLLRSSADNTLLLLPDGPDLEASREAGEGAGRGGDKREAELGEPRVLRVGVEEGHGGRAGVDLGEALRLLRREYGVRSLLVEGGPTLNGRLLSCGLVGELFLTLAPKILGGGEDRGGGPSIVEGLHEDASWGTEPLPKGGDLLLISAYCYRSELFLRYATRTL